jgi:hypothetical protein
MAFLLQKNDGFLLHSYYGIEVAKRVDQFRVCMPLGWDRRDGRNDTAGTTELHIEVLQKNTH